MADLTVPQIDEVRGDTGDTDDKPDVPDTTMNLIFNDPARANGDVDRLKVYVLRWRLGMNARQINQSGENSGINETRAQIYDHLKDLLSMWEAITGMAADRLQPMTAGVVDLNLDRSLRDEWGNWWP